MEVWDSPCSKLEVPGNGARNSLMVCRQSHARWDTPRGRYDEWSSKFSLSMKPRLNRPVGGSESSEGWCHWRWQGALPVSATTWNLHTTQPNYFAPTVQWGCQSHRSCWKQRIRRIVWKMVFVYSKVNENNDCSGKSRNCSGLYYQCKRMDRGS